MRCLVNLRHSLKVKLKSYESLELCDRKGIPIIRPSLSKIVKFKVCLRTSSTYYKTHFESPQTGSYLKVRLDLKNLTQDLVFLI